MEINYDCCYFTQAELKFTVPFSNHRTKVFSRSSLFFVVYNNRLLRKISLSDPYCTFSCRKFGSICDLALFSTRFLLFFPSYAELTLHIRVLENTNVPIENAFH